MPMRSLTHGHVRAGAALAAGAAGFVAGLAATQARKAVAQAPALAAGDWAEALKAEHRLVEALFDRLLATPDGHAGKRQALLAKIAHALTRHAVEEETTVYPALKAIDPERARHLFEDHAEIKTFLHELKGADAGAAAWLERARAFQACVRHHVREEEDEVFPFFHARMTDAENARLTRALTREGFRIA